MRLERISLAVVAIIALIILVVPFWRGLALSELRQILPGQAHSIWTGVIDPSFPIPNPKADSQLLKEHPHDFLLRLALTQEQIEPSLGMDKSSSEAKRAIAELIRDYPKQPAVYELALNMPDYEQVQVPPRIEAVDVRPEEAVKCWHDPGRPTKEQLDGCRRCIGMLDKAIAADPHDGWFRLVKAFYLYGLHEDDAALREVHLAAAAPRVADCSAIRNRAWDHLYDLRGGFNPVLRARGKLGMALPFLAYARQTAMISAHLAYARIRKGEKDEGVAIALDAADAGYKMSRDAWVHVRLTESGCNLGSL